jgi:hypothetical protein
VPADYPTVRRLVPAAVCAGAWATQVAAAASPLGAASAAAALAGALSSHALLVSLAAPRLVSGVAVPSSWAGVAVVAPEGWKLRKGSSASCFPIFTRPLLRAVFAGKGRWLGAGVVEEGVALVAELPAGGCSGRPGQGQRLGGGSHRGAVGLYPAAVELMRRVESMGPLSCLLALQPFSKWSSLLYICTSHVIEC